MFERMFSSWLFNNLVYFFLFSSRTRDKVNTVIRNESQQERFTGAFTYKFPLPNKPFFFRFCHGVSKTVFFEASGDVKNGPF